MTINSVKDTANFIGEKIDMENTSSGHYMIPLRPSQETIFMALDMKGKSVRGKKKTAKKLHQQLGHLSHDKLLQLVRTAGDWLSAGKKF